MTQLSQKIQRRVAELERFRYRASQSVGPLTATQVQVGTEAVTAEPITLTTGTRWGERDAIYHMQLATAIPTAWRGQALALHLDLSVPRPDLGLATVEGLIFIDGFALHALDRYHREIVLDERLTTRETLEVEIHLWTGIDEANHVVGALELRLLDRVTDALMLRMRALLDATSTLSQTSPTAIALYTALDRACGALDFRDGQQSDAFYAACGVALETLERDFSTLRSNASNEGGEWQPHTLVTGHAHIDVAWLWQLRHTRMKAANTFTSALYHMERYPHFIFTASTPQLYEFVKEDHPEVYSRIKERIAAGQWEAEGGMWVEADTNITGGESLVRQFLFGQRFMQQEFGSRNKVLWLPDVFGYSAALPQIIKASGAEYFVTTKISWNDTNRAPFDTFWWEGLDGTRVLTHFITAQNSANSGTFFTYNAEMKPSTLAYTWNNYKQKSINRELLVAYGWGDGGGGPTREMVVNAGNWAQPLDRALPTASPGKVADFMERLNARVTDDPTLPRWQGELYLEYHRGTYTSQARTKRNNRLAERDLHNAEWLATLASHLTGATYPHADLAEAWKIVLTHQFHDIIPGSSIGPVYADAAVNYAHVATITSRLIDAAQQAIDATITTPTGSLIVTNPSTWRRDGLIEIATEQADTLDLPQQSLDAGRSLVYVNDIPAYGFAAIAPSAIISPSPANLLVATPTLLESIHYRIELNERGEITRLLDKAGYGDLGREVLRQGDRANVFQFFEDKPIDFDAWDIDSFYERKQWEMDAAPRITVVETGPLRGGLRFDWRYRDRTTISQVMYIYLDSRRIDFVTEVDWHERQTLLKVAFPVDIHNGRATAEIQFGNVERATHRNTSWDQARFETCAHKWFDLSEGDYGVAMLNDCKYGYDIHERTLRQTLLKGAISPDPHADEGQHRFIYSLLPHEGGWFDGHVHREAYALNYPLLATMKMTAGQPHDVPPTYSLVATEGDHIVIETIKTAEESDALIVRLYECANRRGPFYLQLPFRASRVMLTNLLEEETVPATLSDDGQSIEGFITPYQIMTLKIER